ncbi:MAG: ATP-binding protein, partial [Sphingobacteriales bacterium]
AIPSGTTPMVILWLNLDKDGKTIRTEVRDNGTGIPEELLDKVFVPNFSTKYAGSGIGLAVAKKGIEQMGGKIWFSTTLHKGTTFFIELPLAD